MSNNNYELTDWKQVFISMGACIILFLITMYALKDNMNSIVEAQRGYEKFSVEEIEWRKRTQHNLNRPMDKKINV